jgi:hypothetical protein
MESGRALAVRTCLSVSGTRKHHAIAAKASHELTFMPDQSNEAGQDSMENTNSLLVALMFVTILTVGIVNLITVIASVREKSSKQDADRAAFGWIVFLLLIHLHIFWQALMILEQEQWAFTEFLFVITGPVLLLYTSRILIVSRDDADISIYSQAHFNEVRREFFISLSLLMLWALGLEFFFGNGAGTDAAVDLAVFAVFALLAVTAKQEIALTVIAWILIVTLFALQDAGLIS